MLLGIGFALPAAHNKHAVAFDAPVLGLYVPAGHSSNVMLALVAPMLAQNPPAGHGSQLEDPVVALKLPTSQGVHESAPPAAVYVPSEHAKH